MSVRERIFAESLGMFSVAFLGGAVAKSTRSPMQNVAVVVTTAALEIICISPRVLEYLNLPPERGWGQRVLSFGSTFVWPALLMGAGLYFGAATEYLNAPDKTGGSLLK